MKKLRLDLSELRVESFDTSPGHSPPPEGTVRAYGDSDPGETCDEFCETEPGFCGTGTGGGATWGLPGTCTYGGGETCWDVCYLSNNSDCECTSQLCTTQYCGTTS